MIVGSITGVKPICVVILPRTIPFGLVEQNVVLSNSVADQAVCTASIDYTAAEPTIPSECGRTATYRAELSRDDDS